MIPLGIAQVISALVIAIFTDNKAHREHFLYYLGGVIAYFIILYTLAMTPSGHIGLSHGAKL